jgi:hypothetical protein
MKISKGGDRSYINFNAKYILMVQKLPGIVFGIKITNGPILLLKLP